MLTSFANLSNFLKFAAVRANTWLKLVWFPSHCLSIKWVASPLLVYFLSGDSMYDWSTSKIIRTTRACNECKAMQIFFFFECNGTVNNECLQSRKMFMLSLSAYFTNDIFVFPTISTIETWSTFYGSVYATLSIQDQGGNWGLVVFMFLYLHIFIQRYFQEICSYPTAKFWGNLKEIYGCKVQLYCTVYFQTNVFHTEV